MILDITTCKFIKNQYSGADIVFERNPGSSQARGFKYNQIKLRVNALYIKEWIYGNFPVPDFMQYMRLELNASLIGIGAFELTQHPHIVKVLHRSWGSFEYFMLNARLIRYLDHIDDGSIYSETDRDHFFSFQCENVPLHLFSRLVNDRNEEIAEFSNE